VKRALVTGSAGFLGRHLCAALEDQGYLTMRVDKSRTAADARKYFQASPRTDYFDVVLHCAAVGADRASIDSSPLSLAVNFELDAGLFRWAERARPGRVVYFSSSAAYPTVLQQRDSGHRLSERDINLRHPQAPDGIYGWAKLTGERLAALARDAGVPVSVVRPFSGYGEDQGERFPFRALAARARRCEDPFTVWGSGAQVRDFIHVDDIVAAVMRMVSEGIDGPVNLGTGRGISMLDLAAEICAAAGHHPRLDVTGRHEGVSYRVADPALLQMICPPKVTLEEGVARMMKS
jgi:UDP-glucose 4-epimerase